MSSRNSKHLIHDDDDIFDDQLDECEALNVAMKRPRVSGSFLVTKYKGICGLLVGLSIGALLSRALERSMDGSFTQSAAAVKYPLTKFDGPTFILNIGIEGTGHHFIQAIHSRAPAIEAMDRVGANIHMASIRRDFMRGMMMPYCQDQPKHNDPQALYQNMIGIQSSDKHELSYPDAKRCNRMQHPNLDMFYSACRDAQVNCGAVYLYRDPYAILLSNQRRRFNPNVQAGIHLYTMMLQIIYAQLSYYPKQTLACIGLYDDDAADAERWHPIRDMYGWTDATAFQTLVDGIYRVHPAMTVEEQDALVPPEYQAHMRAMVHAHEKVLDQCRRIVRENKLGLVTGES
ncbi:hypothetical protein MPSEU_000677000 [Mayamaea pseudoterrestris]|nr:hypothetical protein MPSEU_000676900 [Mayamaea pseudoterrestris]GKY97186.1 hypothetical protein MPSEU_000677000 [Mayamaea pseudoterrestris]